MLGKVFSAAILGLETKTIEIETEVNFGLRHFQIVGLPDKAIQESAQRVSLALKNSNFPSPSNLPQRVIVSLAPADLKKEGSLYDLPIALSYLLSAGEINFSPENKLFLGELSLDGTLRRIKGALAFSLHAKKEGFKEIILPKENAKEASLVKGIKVIGVESLKEAVGYLKKEIEILPTKSKKEYLNLPNEDEINLDQIEGQEIAKRALEIAAAGSHHLFFLGPPGVGKSLLAKAIVSILPPLDFQEALELTKIYSILGLLPPEKPLITKRPFRAPHHSSSEVGLIGGGNPPLPGEITLAHLGILFLDEFPEFHRDVLESLRQPLEEGEISILRAKQRVVFPAKFTLIGASNPCPCGYFGDEQIQCKCQFSQVQKYQRKISGPLIDRIDLFVEVPRVKFEKIGILKQNQTEEAKKRVKKAKEIQRERFKKEKISANGQMQISHLKKYCAIDSESKNFLRKFVDSGMLTLRGYHKVLKVARTICDLKEKENISLEEISEAVSFRKKEV